MGRGGTFFFFFFFLKTTQPQLGVIPTDLCVGEVVLVLFPALDKVLLLLSAPHASLCPAPQLSRAERYFFIQSDVVSAAFTWCGEDLTSGFSEAEDLSELRQRCVNTPRHV